MTVRGYYENAFDEGARLSGDSLEWLRSCELIARALPAPPARIADVAGGTGPYSRLLAGLGHQVCLLDLVPAHVHQARQKATEQALGIECVVGDARSLPWPDQSFDVVLVMGALYHLQERDDRVACLREAHRVLRPGGSLVAAYISRFASLVDGYRHGHIEDERFRAIVAADLSTGRHQNPYGNPDWFTTSYFHTPDEIRDELTQAMFSEARVLAVEGFASATGIPAGLRNPEGIQTVLDQVRLTEAEPALLGASSHLMAIARK